MVSSSVSVSHRLALFPIDLTQFRNLPTCFFSFGAGAQIFNCSHLPSHLRPVHPKLGPWNSRECWCYCCNNNCGCASCTIGEPYISICARDLAKDPTNSGRTFCTCLNYDNHSFPCAHTRNVHQVHCKYKLGDVVMGVWNNWKSGEDETRWNMEPCRDRHCDLLTMIVNLCDEGLCKRCCTSAGCCS